MHFTFGIPAELLSAALIAAVAFTGGCDDSERSSAPVSAGDDGGEGTQNDGTQPQPAVGPSVGQLCHGNDDCELKCEGLECDPVCGGTSTCAATCAEGAVCRQRCEESGACAVRCAKGESCDAEASGSADLDLACEGAGRCDATCKGSAHCQIDAGVQGARAIECRDSAACFVRCPAGGCALDCSHSSTCELTCEGSACSVVCKDGASCRCTGESCALDCGGTAPVQCLASAPGQGDAPVFVCDASQC